MSKLLLILKFRENMIEIFFVILKFQEYIFNI